MKRYIRSSYDPKDVNRYVDRCIRNVADYFYSNVSLIDDDARADYFVENICSDPEVELYKKKLVDALFNAKARQMGYNP